MTDKFFRQAHDPLYVPERGPESVSPPPRHLYEIMGPAAVRAMLIDFYEELSQSAIAGMFRGEKVASAERSALFFIGLLGGPPVYAQAHGSPRMRARHLPFRIDAHAQNVWLACFDKVLEHPERYQMPAEDVPAFRAFLQDFSAWMVNTES